MSTNKTIILLIGIPGSGKSTIATKLINRGFVSISADTIRFELYGDEAIQGDKDEVFRVFYERLTQNLKDENKIVIDNTNIKSIYRQQIIDLAKQNGYNDIQLWILDIPLDICLARNAKRKRQASEEVIKKMHKDLYTRNYPLNEEGKVRKLRLNKDQSDYVFLS